MSTVSASAGSRFFYSDTEAGLKKKAREHEFWNENETQSSLLGKAWDEFATLEEVELFGKTGIVSAYKPWRFYDKKTGLEFDLTSAAGLPIVNLPNPNFFLRLGVATWEGWFVNETVILEASTPSVFAREAKDMDMKVAWGVMLRFREKDEKEWPVTLVQKCESRLAYTATEPLSRSRYFELRCQRIHSLRLRLRQGWLPFMVNS